MIITQQIRGTEATEDARVLPPGTITVDLTANAIRVHDGVKVGGHKMAAESSIGASHTREFNETSTESTPGAVAIVNKFANFTVAGDYDIPELSDIPMIGQGFYVQANTSGVILKCQGADVISDQGADVTSLALVENEIVRIVKRSSARYVVVSRY